MTTAGFWMFILSKIWCRWLLNGFDTSQHQSSSHKLLGFSGVTNGWDFSNELRVDPGHHELGWSLIVQRLCLATLRIVYHPSFEGSLPSGHQKLQWEMPFFVDNHLQMTFRGQSSTNDIINARQGGTLDYIRVCLKICYPIASTSYHFPSSLMAICRLSPAFHRRSPPWLKDIPMRYPHLCLRWQKPGRFVVGNGWHPTGITHLLCNMLVLI